MATDAVMPDTGSIPFKISASKPSWTISVTDCPGNQLECDELYSLARLCSYPKELSDNKLQKSFSVSCSNVMEV